MTRPGRPRVGSADHRLRLRAPGPESSSRCGPCTGYTLRLTRPGTRSALVAPLWLWAFRLEVDRDFRLLTSDLSNLRKYQISTVDYVPQAAHKLLCTYQSVLYAMVDKLPQNVDIPDSGRHYFRLNTFSATWRHSFVDYVWRSLLSFVRMTIIWGNTHYKMPLRLSGQGSSWCDAAIKAFALKRPWTANMVQIMFSSKNKQALILTKKCNLSKVYKALTQDGLVDYDAIETLFKQHRFYYIALLNYIQVLLKISWQYWLDKINLCRCYHLQVGEVNNG